jgi:hypothetical protein
LLSNPTPDQVRSIAPDPAAARAGEALANRRTWSATGRNGRAAWGLCQGSGASPYQTAVDFAGPAFKCSCPSRKFPCKHALGLMFLLAADAPAFPTAAEPPGWASEWLASREQRAEKAEARSATDESRVSEPDPAARAKRIQARERKVDAGLSDLDRWLQDLVRRGLAAAKSEGYAFWDQAAARLVDAQAASLGREVRTLGAITNSGAGWADGALERVGRLHLIVEAYRRLEALPEDLRADVRSLVGWTVKEDELPPDGIVSDRWLVLGRTVTADDRLTTARTWMTGEQSRRFALHLAFTVGGVNPAPLAMPGSSFQGDLVFYPSATPLRVAVDAVGDAGPAITSLPAASSIADAVGTFAGVLARNPFVTSWPVILADVVPIGRGTEMHLRDSSGAAVRAAPDAIAARLLALAGGHSVTVFGLWSGRATRVLAAIADGRFVDLGTETAGDEAGGPSIPPRQTGDGDPWGRLVSAALLGTGRTEVPDLQLAAPVAGLATRPAESRLLGAAAVMAASRRAGWQPPTDDAPLPAPAPPDDRPQVGAQAGWLLRRALDDRPELAAEWLGLAAAARRRPPNDELPRLLALAGRHRETRIALAPVLGPRAAWLVEQLPELGAGLAAPTGDPSAAWDAATGAAERAAVIAGFRSTDPEAARDLLATKWDDATTEERALAISAFGTGLAADDTALLERAATDSRTEVRSASIDLLARLPDSAFARLADETARPTLELTGRFRPSLEARPPAAWDESLARLGIPKKPPQGTGERAWWHRHLLARVAPSRWEAWLGADPAALVDRALRSDDARALVEGWVEAAIRFGDADWATALLAHKEIASGDAVPNVDPLALLDALLTTTERDPVAVKLIGMGDTAAALKTAEHCPAPWSSLLSWAVLTALAKEGKSIGISKAFVDLTRMAARRLPTEHAEQLETIVVGDGSRPGTYPILREYLELIEFRKRMRAAFAAEEGSR